MSQTLESPSSPTTIAALERRCRVLAWVAALALFCGVFAVLVLALQRIGTEGGALRAQGFVLEDFDGRVRASLELAAGEREVRLEMRDLEGRTRLIAMVGPTGMPQIHLRDEHGRARLGLGVLPDGSSTLTLNGADGAPRATLRAEEDAGRLMVRASADSEPIVIPAREEPR